MKKNKLLFKIINTIVPLLVNFICIIEIIIIPNDIAGIVAKLGLVSLSIREIFVIINIWRY